ncbi:DUF4328 domain-containing protein [Kitasatospora sp. NPDC051170]|uniref:DUF4328 domain-containing protein n=1 Tax=Kitasatospora sp. NPDC051170 TaxID=3364056 RepID=UPI0037A1E391
MSSPAVYQPPRTVATVTTVLLAVSAGVALLSAVAALLMYASADDLTHVLGGATALVTLTGVLQLLALAGTAAAFITWFYRVRVNAEVFDPMGHRMSRGWAIGAWFTPIVNLWFPRQIALDTWQASVRPDASGVRVLPHALLNGWWVTFALARAVDRIGGNMADVANYSDSCRHAAMWLLVSDVLDVVAAGLAIAVVQKLTAAQEERHAEAVARAFPGTGFPGAHGAHGATAWN